MKGMALAPIHWRCGFATIETTLCWIESAVPDVTEVNLPKEGVRFAHSCQNPDRRNPQHDSSDDAPPLHNGKNKHGRQNGKDEHHLPIPAK
jgi:hypothetical protein